MNTGMVKEIDMESRWIQPEIDDPFWLDAAVRKETRASYPRVPYLMTPPASPEPLTSFPQPKENGNSVHIPYRLLRRLLKAHRQECGNKYVTRWIGLRPAAAVFRQAWEKVEAMKRKMMDKRAYLTRINEDNEALLIKTAEKMMAIEKGNAIMELFYAALNKHNNDIVAMAARSHELDCYLEQAASVLSSMTRQIITDDLPQLYGLTQELLEAGKNNGTVSIMQEHYYRVSRTTEN